MFFRCLIRWVTSFLDFNKSIYSADDEGENLYWRWWEYYTFQLRLQHMPSLFPYLHRWLAKPNAVWTSEKLYLHLLGKPSYWTQQVECRGGREENMKISCYGSVTQKHIWILATICEYGYFSILLKKHSLLRK